MKKLIPMILVLFAACQGGTPISPGIETATLPTLPSPTPSDTPPPLASPTSPGPRSIAPVPVEEMVAMATATNDEGTAIFDDPLSEYTLRVEFQDAVTRAPAPDIQVWFVSNGPKVLVMAVDPAGQYVSTFEELAYEELVAEALSGVRAVVLLVKSVDLHQDMAAWLAYWDSRPAVEAWSLQFVDVCVNPEQAQPGLEAEAGLIGIVKKLPEAGVEGYEQAYRLLYEGLAIQGSGDFLTAYGAAEAPSIMQFRVWTVKEGLPQILRLVGFCLPPLIRTDAQSALDWLLYGLEHRDPYPFKVLSHERRVAYANYIEGGQDNTPQEFLADVESRLPNGAQCQGITRYSRYIQVWTTGWTPAWEMNEYCYIECSPLNPPFFSADAGFFLFPVNEEWRLTVGFLNTPDNYFFTDNFQMAACHTDYANIPEADPIHPTPTTKPSCPGAPPQQMAVDQRGYVCTQEDRIIVRAGPGRSHPEVGRLSPGAEFTVTGGPSCANNWSWWEILTDDGIIGWVSEGGDSVDPYYICPLR